MTKGKRQKDKQYNGQRKTTKGQTIYWPRYKQYIGQRKNDKTTKNIMAKGKTTKGQTI